jgi:hypothetical protein
MGALAGCQSAYWTTGGTSERESRYQQAQAEPDIGPFAPELPPQERMAAAVATLNAAPPAQ